MKECAVFAQENKRVNVSRNHGFVTFLNFGSFCLSVCLSPDHKLNVINLRLGGWLDKDHLLLENVQSHFPGNPLSSVQSQITFAHEMGHALGAQHDTDDCIDDPKKVDL